MARGKSGAWKIPLPDNLGLCELVDRRLDESGRGLVPPNGLLQTLDHVGAQGYLAATVADFSRHVVDQNQTLGQRREKGVSLNCAISYSAEQIAQADAFSRVLPEGIGDKPPRADSNCL